LARPGFIAQDRVVLIRIEGYDLPPTAGEHVRIGVQRLKDVEQLVPTDDEGLAWDLEATAHRDADGAIDLRGPYVHGRHGDRFLYLSWGTVDGGAETFTMFRRAKLMLAAVDTATIEEAESNGRTLVGRLRLTGQDGTPICAAVRPPAITWTVD
jgi:Family of unknown function (DUF5990)